ncbi:CocE/NonD family hydrolase [Aldersonia sp. NBC_00410]|uniref:CocE/NonD family hydrolase n=1 Tax=Aldersonia sp. NBC_00410 TaxID=2975954 RepID=UPI002253781A|nr:CocE/NonD family hydrolase [Aldersonia sp. NBC_00410]MCX5042266.1 CocE/NonD family hydrolase [Aldersonia sp. NBC_00410]
MAALVFAGATASAAPIMTPDAGNLGATWTAVEDGPQQYPNVHIDWDVPITMSDGVVLKANVYRPADASGRPIDTPLPTILNMTAYTKLVSAVADATLSIPGFSDALMKYAREFDLSGTPFAGITELTQALGGGFARNFAVDRQLVRSGYTQVVADVRGTGFSQGVWNVFQAREQQDTVETIDWAGTQPWSNGKVGMTGASYSGINQVQAAAKHPPNLEAIFPVVPGNDLMRDIVAPGGMVGVAFLVPWLLAVNGTKMIPDVSALASGRFDWKWLSDRIASPFTFVDLVLASLTTPTIDAVPPNLAELLTDVSSIRQDWLGQASRIRIPTFIIGGWHDLFANGEPRIYNEIPLPPGQKQLVMGDTYHISASSGFGEPGAPPRTDVLQRAWFDKWLKGIDNGIDRYGPVNLFQQGGGWTTTSAFPRPGTSYQRMYLSAAPSGTAAHSQYDGSLLPTPPSSTNQLTIGPGVTSVCSRDTAYITAGASAVLVGCSRDARPQELDGLTFTAAPVTRPTPISGPINVHLNTVHDATDGFWTATLNDVAPEGTSVVLTTGQLTSSLREVDPSHSRYSANGDLTDPYNTLTLASRQPVVPGQPTQLDVGLTPTDAVLAPGHRLRVDIYASNFPKGTPLRPLLNESALAQQHLLLDPDAPSFVNVPLG